MLDMKEASLLNAQILPFLDYKSLPSYAYCNLICNFYCLQ